MESVASENNSITNNIDNNYPQFYNFERQWMYEHHYSGNIYYNLCRKTFFKGDDMNYKKNSTEIIYISDEENDNLKENPNLATIHPSTTPPSLTTDANPISHTPHHTPRMGNGDCVHHEGGDGVVSASSSDVSPMIYPIMDHPIMDLEKKSLSHTPIIGDIHPISSHQAFNPQYSQLFGGQLTPELYFDKKRFYCEICNKNYKTKGGLKRHHNACHTNIVYTCNICFRNYKYKSCLVYHKKHKAHYTKEEIEKWMKDMQIDNWIRDNMQEFYEHIL